MHDVFRTIRDGRALLALLAFGLLTAGIIAVLLGVSGRFLPHDERFLGMNAEDLCAVYGCRIVHFMIHDRISFGGVLIALGIVYGWLIAVPLSDGEAWAWWLLLTSGTVGFASFFAYLGFGYFDLWHGIATLALLPCFVFGLIQSRPIALGCTLASGGVHPHRNGASVSWVFRRDKPAGSRGLDCNGFGWRLLTLTMAGIFAAGFTILCIGMTCVFVPQDLAFMGLNVAELEALNPRLVPLIAHDRAGFGGALCSCGLALFFCVRCGKPSRSLWWMLAATGIAGFGAGIGAHPFAGYTDPVHLAPAVVGALVYAVGLIATCRTTRDEPPDENGVTLDKLPRLADLGTDLERISPLRRAVSLAVPFGWCGIYFAFATLGWWPAAVFALIALSFVTYGSVSHDLVHRNLGLPRTVNDVLLCMTELLAVRSGHAYRATHLHHHARYPHADDIESMASRKSFFGAIVEGFTFQPRLWFWALRHAPRERRWIVGEGIACLILIALATASTLWTPMFVVYVVLMIAGSWVIPLVTSYVPHDPNATGELFQTRVFRGKVASLIALEHLYHLEHHLYPSVPHQNWPKLARRLDPYFRRAGVVPIKL